MPIFFQKLRKMLLNLSSAAIVIGALRVNENAVGPDQLASDESIRSRSTLIPL